VIRIYSSPDGIFLHEVRRGKEKANIFDISFSENSYYISCTSDRGTVHIFSLATIKDKLLSINKE
jgi:WD40 repeat protein